MRAVLISVLVALSLPAAASAAAEGLAMTDGLTFSCGADNDIYVAVTAAGTRAPRFASPAAAIDAAPVGSGVLILAGKQDADGTVIEPASLQAARKKGLRLFIEYPRSLPGLVLDAARTATWERVIVPSDAFGPDAGLPPLRILASHGSSFMPASNARDPLLVVGRVAGFDTAVYGLPRESYPILFRTAEGDLVATMRLSNFVSARYAPARRWAAIWHHILSTLDPDGGVPTLEIEPVVRPGFAKSDLLPQSAERDALGRFARWVGRSGLLVAAEQSDKIHELLRTGVITTAPPAADDPVGDGSHGVLEGFASQIRSDGHQSRYTSIRADCQAETAMALALHALVTGDRSSKALATNLLDFLYTKSGMQGGVRGDPKHPAYGLIAWGMTSPAWEAANYGDDNARTLLGTMAAAACLQTDAWDEAMLKALLANLRTTGAHGFRGDRVDVSDLERHGWRHYYDAKTINYALNFEAYLWACYLWAYRQTGEMEFLDKARSAIRMTMAAYPDGWRWADNMERARILLPLAWLVRVEDTPEHRAWINRVAGDLLKNQVACGAIREHLGGEGKGAGHYVVPATNEAYGTSETPLIQRNGDPVADQLYTTGFALLGLHECAAATNDPALLAAEEKLAAFLVRVQTRSKALPYLDGTWFRAFDFGQWDYWASSADVGWGAWSVEAGWGPAWIAATLGLRASETSLWELTAASKIERHLSSVKPLMTR